MQTEVLLQQIFDQHQLSQQQAKEFFTAVMQGEISNEQLAAALIALKIKGETVDEISGAVQAMQNAALSFPSPDYDFADIVGTGGDNANTINISTATALVGASCGLKIAKHGNRSVSSQTGSSDLLNAFGINLQMSPEQSRLALDKIGICFLFAQQYHPGFKHAVPVRQALKTRTIFNILGPLINPARPKYQLLGVYSPQLLQPYAETVAKLGHRHTIIVHGCGLDEVAIHGKTEIAEVIDGEINYYSVSPQDFGFQPQPLETLRGGNVEQNKSLIQALLQGQGKKEHQQAVAMNCAMLMKLFGYQDLKANAEQAMQQMATGKPFEILCQLKEF